MNIINKIESEQLKQDVAEFNVGDTVKVHCRVIEGGKERIQIFAGLVIARGGSGVNAAFTVRKISYGEGVERVFPLHTPRIAKIEVTNKGKVRRAKLHYLRERVGKRALLVKSATDPSPILFSKAPRPNFRAGCFVFRFPVARVRANFPPCAFLFQS
ncbi:MAG: 50S ribosomal protein L19 [Akkermansiaceae bacterium]|nr:50S ribosomal protein L19 [Akkermansiaceae bacterium]